MVTILQGSDENWLKLVLSFGPNISTFMPSNSDTEDGGNNSNMKLFVKIVTNNQFHPPFQHIFKVNLRILLKPKPYLGWNLTGILMVLCWWLSLKFWISPQFVFWWNCHKIWLVRIGQGHKVSWLPVIKNIDAITRSNFSSFITRCGNHFICWSSKALNVLFCWTWSIIIFIITTKLPESLIIVRATYTNQVKCQK